MVLADINAGEGEAAARSLGGGALFRPLDVADETDVAGFLERPLAETGGLDVLVNSAGLLQNRAVSAEFALPEHDRIWAVNYRGTYLMCRACGPALAAAGGGAILNIASINSFTPLPLPAYTNGRRY